MTDLKKISEKVKELIYKRSNPKAYSEEIKVKTATLYDFLNHGKGMNVKTFFKIIAPLGLRVEGDENFVEVETVWCDKKRLKKGHQHEGKEILICFGDSLSSKQCLLLKNKEGKHELVVC